MHTCGAIWLVLASLWLTSATAAGASEASLVTLDTKRGVRQSFILIKPAQAPVAAVILHAGGHGALGLQSPTAMRWGGGNFLVRSREQFAAQGLLVAVLDAPSDHQGGMNAVFRMSGDHAGDIGAVVAHLKKIAKVPVWLVGTSMGTFSAASGAVHGSGADGIVLTSTITRAKPDWKIASSHANGVASMPIGTVRLPVLVMSHLHDGCDITPAADSGKLKARLSAAKTVKVVTLDGGSPPRSDPCEAFSQHGFLGIEDKAVGEIVAFIKSGGT